MGHPFLHFVFSERIHPPCRLLCVNLNWLVLLDLYRKWQSSRLGHASDPSRNLFPHRVPFQHDSFWRSYGLFPLAPLSVLPLDQLHCVLIQWGSAEHLSSVRLVLHTPAKSDFMHCVAVFGYPRFRSFLLPDEQMQVAAVSNATRTPFWLHCEQCWVGSRK